MEGVGINGTTCVWSRRGVHDEGSLGATSMCEGAKEFVMGPRWEKDASLWI